MVFRQSDILSSARYSAVRKTVASASAENKRTAFLCHSHKDADLAKGLQSFLHDQGWEVYIDWEDATMPATPDRNTARKIQKKIASLEMFFFLATQNSMSSRWCPWEIGYADGVKDLNRILLIQTVDNGGTTYGNEYLQLYQRLGHAASGGIGYFDSNGGGFALRADALPR